VRLNLGDSQASKSLNPRGEERGQVREALDNRLRGFANRHATRTPFSGRSAPLQDRAGASDAHLPSRPKVIDQLPPPRRLQSPFRTTSWSISLSRLRSATSRLKRSSLRPAYAAFGHGPPSASSRFKRLISDGIKPPYFFRHLEYVCCEIPGFRQSSSTDVPSSAWRKKNPIRRSLNVDRFTAFSSAATPGSDREFPHLRRSNSLEAGHREEAVQTDHDVPALTRNRREHADLYADFGEPVRRLPSTGDAGSKDVSLRILRREPIDETRRAERQASQHSSGRHN